MFQHILFYVAGHFTQVVWKGSEELGIGKAADSKGRVYVVANYAPAGNFIGDFAANVSRPWEVWANDTQYVVLYLLALWYPHIHFTLR